MEQAARLRQAEIEKTPLKPLTDERPHLTVTDAYAVQMAGLETALGAGRRLCGYKMGLTSKAKQHDVKVDEPIRGYLLSDMELVAGAPFLSESRIHPRVEPEVAIRFRTGLKGAVSLRDVCEAAVEIIPALEILDSRYRGFAFQLPDVIADNASAAGFLLGATNLLGRLGDLPLMGVVLRKNGEVHETGTPGAVLGNPLLSVIHLSRMLAQDDRAIEPGMIVLTGGITASLPVGPGDWIEAQWPGATVELRVK